MTDTNNTDGAALLPVTHPIDMLREMLASEIKRTSTAESFMIRSGLLADLLDELASLRQSHSLPGDVGTVERVARAIHRARYKAEWDYTPTDEDQGSDWKTFESHAVAAIAALTPSPCPGDVDEPTMVPRYPTDDMVQAGLYQLGGGGDEWAMVCQIWIDMFTAITMDGGVTESLPAEPVSLADKILWHVEQVCGPLSTETVENPGDDDRSVLLHNIRAALTPSAVSGDKGGSDFLGMFDGPQGVINRPTQRYRKTALIEATQWFKDGDHPAVRMSDDIREAMEAGHAVPWIDTLEGGHIVTPGDWIATGVQGEHWPIKPDIFAATYEPVSSALSGDAGEVEPFPGCYADLQQRRVTTLAKLGLMLSVMASGDAPEVVGYDAAELYAEVLMALAIEDAEDTDIALEIARDHPEADILAGHRISCPPVTEEAEKVAAWLEQYPSPMNDLDMAMRIRQICARIRAGAHRKSDATPSGEAGEEKPNGVAENKAGGLWYRRWYTAQTRVNELEALLANPPKHKFWGAGEPDCPREIKAPNGELHTLRCKVCGLDNPRNDLCRAALPSHKGAE